jgi:hypothetical protein
MKETRRIRDHQEPGDRVNAAVSDYGKQFLKSEDRRAGFRVRVPGR